ncbi:MAG: hypothetical protein JNK57_20555 [Planctomycetaceae bacterium]|nr:hypothetical protein [Planctomycetaceae bacterium]
MAVLSVTELQRYVSNVQQEILALKRRFAPLLGNRGTSSPRNFSYFKVTKPILPGRQGLAVQVSYNTLITSPPIDPEDPEQFWLSDEYEGWTEISSAEFEIHDSAHKTLAMVGDIIVAEYRYNKWRTFTEFGLANVRAKVLEDVEYTTGPAVQAKYQILIGDAETPQVYEGHPVYVTRLVTQSLFAGEQFLLSYDRTAKEWFLVNGPPINATCGTSIGPGEQGAIVLNYCGGSVAVNAINHSNCTFDIGDRITAYNQCEKYYFTGCKCCDSAPVACCDRFIAVCVNGYIQIIPLQCPEGIGGPWEGGGWYFFPVGTCCIEYATWACSVGETPGNPEFFQFAIKVCCDGPTITAYYGFTCTGGAPTDPEFDPRSGQWDWSNLCDDPATGYTQSLLLESEGHGSCAVTVVSASSASIGMCNPCDGEPPDPENCCDKLLWFCLNGESVQLAVNGGSHTFDVTDCCEGCTSATLAILLSCNSETGVITLQWTYICDGSPPAVAVENILMSMFCTSNDPRVININEGCFLQLLVSINDAGCETCEPSPSLTPTPP